LFNNFNVFRSVNPILSFLKSNRNGYTKLVKQ